LDKNVECYVVDVEVKTKKRSDHLKDLRVVFERLRKYNLKMNPLKCAFGVMSGKFLNFIVKHRLINPRSRPSIVCQSQGTYES
ncbi:hypothetical protein KJ032_27170, partial [Salmonella enterica subsp. enterica serovar Typhimurium]|nr:hypothetical protein [Salmonella enterica subsp. enterica serovar Typhimurium]